MEIIRFRFPDMNLQEFEQQLKSHARPVIVDVWAPWCIPCRATQPILETLAHEYRDRVDLLVINADEHPQLVSEMGIFGIPTVLATHSGAILKKVAGAQSREYYRLIFEALASAEGQVHVSMSGFDRLVRLFAGTALVAAGLYQEAWGLTIIGGAVAFLGVYDRCPVWRAITSRFIRRTP